MLRRRHSAGKRQKRVDKLTVTWSLNTEPAGAGADAAYKNVKVNLCYASVSHKDHGWRRADDLSKDKTCQFKVTQQAYVAGTRGSFESTVARDIPTGSYYVAAGVFSAFFVAALVFFVVVENCKKNK
ncbi:high-affinity nitrate transporter-activating protein 2.1-like [Panicum miliaceum]|uniref:High-affinity nitrate transporter-activating protein 2.1-like n=1 Tax=Panicum miliaceum TaxID=4540 RepID=A0A3L6QC43_PANMI|nr:high-affinity nitrate transporter-activating protein 2.1-like [Panicum miliaceum]